MHAVREQYERWPYPRIPLFARIHREQLWQLHLSWLAPRCGRPAPEKPKIWIAGCGTFQPYVFARANPHAKILATDLSTRSLELAKRRCRWQGIRHVRFGNVDLDEPASLPQESFDFIECYGVLMSLQDPARALREMANRLAPQGVLRLMVYPHYSRQRIFQLQRLARLLGLRYGDTTHPALLRKVLHSFPSDHPLRAAFSSYNDARNEEGIVDGFLHASDRGFTAIELFRLAAQAGLEPAFYFHRPWGQPQAMRASLGLQKQHVALVLHVLDLWQELRSNFTICFVKRESSPPSDPSPSSYRHPLWDLSNASTGWRHRSRLARLALTGTRLESRTHESPLALSAHDVRALLRGDRKTLPQPMREILPEKGRTTRLPDLPESFASLAPEPALAIAEGQPTPNPLYSHFFEAWDFSHRANAVLAQPLPTLAEQIERWRAHAEPLENELCPWGLTPWASYLARTKDAIHGLGIWSQQKARVSFSQWTLPDEKEKLRQLDDFLRSFPEFKTLELDAAARRELWVLLFSFPDLLLNPS